MIPPGNKWEPDVAVVRSELEFDSTRDASPSECCLVVEIAETNLFRAQSEKLPAYAAAGIPVYWIVNLTGGIAPGSGVVEVYSDPDQDCGRYRSRFGPHARRPRSGRHRRAGSRADRRRGLAAVTFRGSIANGSNWGNKNEFIAR